MFSDKKYWFKCASCPHNFKTSPSSISQNKWCPYCCDFGGRLCDNEGCSFCFEKSFASHERCWGWCKTNEAVPRKVRKYSMKKYFFVCEKEHRFLTMVRSVSDGHWCSVCKNKTEAKLFSFLQEHFKNPVHQLKISWCKNPETNKFLPFDFCVSKTIIELDGAQHYKQVMNWQSPELTQKSDRYKEEQALKNGYSVLRIFQEDVWNDKIDWKSLLLEHVKDYETPVVKNLWEINKEQ
ncbi:restriction endonuclease [Tunisvirus fontaine2]|uniref:Restriction endonuclease n=1 Tax=Tunisvirus fontaine2 TaxID=1421067 RepID=V9SDL1_9VIRU|nr:restriction endonuclease [Tunisvirus fontaine2]AHC54983.1 restriction endonuclease [Tunisvirus fontaine2]